MRRVHPSWLSSYLLCNHVSNTYKQSINCITFYYVYLASSHFVKMTLYMDGPVQTVYSHSVYYLRSSVRACIASLTFRCTDIYNIEYRN